MRRAVSTRIEVVGRDVELDRVTAFVTAPGSTVRTLLLEGEAGIGKTTIWEWGVAAAHEADVAVLTSRPAGSEVQLSFAGLSDLLGDVAPGVLDALPAPQRRAVEVALALADPDGKAPDARVLSVAVSGVLRRLAERLPFVLAVDDVQWLDASSAAVLGFALRRLRGASVRVLLALRVAPDVRLPPPLADALEPERLRLGPLSPASLQRLVRVRLGESLSYGTLRRVHEVSRGNPFFALELVRALAGQEVTPGETLPVPEDVEALVRERLMRLPRATRDALLAAAMLAEPTLDLLDASALEPAVAAGVVTVSGARVRFTHPQLAAGVEASVPPARRRAVHRELAARVVGTERRARHLALGAEGESAAVAAELERAAQLARARGAPEAGGELAELAVTSTPRHEPGERRRRGRLAAELYIAAGVPGRAERLLEAAVAELEAGPERARLLALLAECKQASDFARAIETAEQALVEGAGDAEVAAVSHRLLGFAYFLLADTHRALEHVNLAVELAESLHDARALALDLSFRGWVERAASGRFDEPALRAATVLADEAGGIRAYWHPRLTLATGLLYRDRLAEARPLLVRQYEQALAEGDTWSLAAVCLHRVDLECRAGRLASAREFFAAAADQIEQWASPRERSALEYLRALPAAYAGEVDAARVAITAGVQHAEEASEHVFRLFNLCTLGFLELSCGNAAAAAEVLRPLPDVLERTGHGGEPSLYPILPNLVEALVALGEVDEARPLLERLEERGRTLSHPWAEALGARCRGLLLAAEGETGRALAAFRAALDAHERTEDPLERGRTLLAYGSVLRRAKRWGDARRALEEALATFERVGAQLWSKRARSELERMGGRAAAEGLTPTERRVAELVAAGRSNREVAAALFVTPKTVEAHLSRIYAKLGVRSRTELGASLRSAPS